LRHRYLKPARLPIPPSGLKIHLSLRGTSVNKIIYGAVSIVFHYRRWKAYSSILRNTLSSMSDFSFLVHQSNVK
ncbi:hypothetical protein, partial [Bartonella sp. AA85SXKL]|uniref:hypothetical protein n=1 Tax=Bartonella sp. AA85SXKL TaxID=3243440 RepID=UPI0035D06A80